MAKRKKGRGSVAPAEMTVYMEMTWNGDATQAFIDISQCVSLINRRYYSQNLNWYVNDFKISTLDQGNILINKIPNTWVVKNSIIKSKAAWNAAIDNAIEESDTEVRGKFLDFKVYMNAAHHQLGFDANLLPAGYNPGQWQPATTRIPTQSLGGVASATEREFIVCGDNLPGPSPVTGLDALSLIEGYAASRRLPHVSDPETPTDMDTNWMVKMFDQPSAQDQEIILDLQGDGTQPPYPFEGDGTNVDTMYPNGANQGFDGINHDTSSITGNTLAGTTYLKGGQFPCGIVNVVAGQFGEGDHNVGIYMTLSPGNHRGYLAEKIEDM